MSSVCRPDKCAKAWSDNSIWLHCEMFRRQSAVKCAQPLPVMTDWVQKDISSESKFAKFVKAPSVIVDW